MNVMIQEYSTHLVQVPDKLILRVSVKVRTQIHKNIWILWPKYRQLLEYRNKLCAYGLRLQALSVLLRLHGVRKS